MKINFITIIKNWFLKNYDINRKHELIVTDSHDNKYSLVDLCASLAKEVVGLEKRIIVLEEKYECALVDIVRLEGENVETTNCLYENSNCIESVDRRIDSMAEYFKLDKTLFY